MRALLAAVAVLVVLAVPSGATAAQRYAAPSGSDVPGACTRSAPCRIDRAVNDAASGDEVIVLPGTYDVPDGLTVTNKSIDLHGEDGQPRPRLVGRAGLDKNVLTIDPAPGAVARVRHLQIEHAVAGRWVLHARDGAAELSDLVLLAGADNMHAAELGDSSERIVLRDSVARMVGISGAAVVARGTEVHLRNVTAIATDGDNSHGLRAQGNCPPGSLGGSACGQGGGPGKVTLRNVIARGGGADLKATRASGGSVAGTIEVRHSNFATVSADEGGSVTDQGANQSAPPRFADAARGDFHQVAGSPTIDAGTADPLLGATDIDGEGRSLGAAPDIGADELAPGAAPASPAQSPAAGGSPGSGGSPGGQAPAAAEPAPGAALAPATPRRVTPRAVAVRIRPARDRVAPYRFAIAGTVVRPSGTPASACVGGRVAVRVKRGRRTVKTRYATLRDDCTFALTVRFVAAERLARGRLTVGVRFSGSRGLNPRAAAIRRVRAG